MTTITIDNPFAFFTDTNGKALENGNIYIGVAGLDAKTNPITVYWDDAKTITALQPIRTVEGYPDNGGSPSSFFTGSDFSITIEDKTDVLIYSKLQMNANELALFLLVDSGALGFKDLPALLADTLLSYTNVDVGDIVQTNAENFSYEVASAVAPDNDITTAGGVRLYAQSMQSGPISAEAIGCEISRDLSGAAALADCAAKIQTVLDRDFDVLIPGYVRVDSLIDTNGRVISGLGNRLSGIWCATAESGVFVNLQGAELRELAVESDFTAEYLVTVGDGVQGNTSNDLKLIGVKATGAQIRCLLVREFANWNAYRCKFSEAGDGNRGSSGGVIIDEGRATAEIRCVGTMIDCSITAATGWALILGFDDVDGWEENRLNFIGGRIQTGGEGLLRVVNYGTYPMTCVFDGVLWENPGIISNPGAAFSGVQEAIQAIGPGATVKIVNPRKFTMRKATAAASSQDGATIELDSSELGFQVLGSSGTGSFCTTRAAEAAVFGSGLYVSNPGFLVTNGGNTYAPKPGLVPFTTTASFDGAQWEDVTSKQGPGRIVVDSYPAPLSDGTVNDFSAFVELSSATSTTFSPSVDFREKELVEALYDGTSIAGLSVNPGASTLGLSTVSGEFLTNGSSIEVVTDTAITSANINFDLNIGADLVGRVLMISAAMAYRQIGGTFGSDGSMNLSWRVRDSTVQGAVTGTCFPPDGTSAITAVDDAPGAGNLTDWFRPVHLFQPLTTGTLRVELRYDSRNVSRDDDLLVDNIKLWAVTSHVKGSLI